MALAACGGESCARSPAASASARDAIAEHAAARTPAQIRAEGNHLLGAGSLYLTEHAHNPVDWYPWGPEALARATAEDRPIFLSIGYSSCHWCHVMEHEVFEQDDVAEYLNQHFVAIKVDREERPDLDAVYMDAVLSMTGSGGWPMSVLMTPSLRPFFGATYMPKARFMEVTKGAFEQFTSDRNGVEERGNKVCRAIASLPKATESPALAAEDVHAIAKESIERVDPVWGGFGGRTKFPTPPRWSFVLHAYRKWGDATLADATKKTLDAMASGGIHDHVGGGFHRYATEPTWVVPHFEKMLYDNAQLAALYLEASAVFGEPRYRDVANDTLDFLLREMRDPGGGFSASFDADSGGREGAFYAFTPAELESVAGDADGAALALLLGVTLAGNFDGTNVITRRASTAEVAKKTGRAEADVAALWGNFRTKLRESREKRPRPRRDAKVVTSWNGLTIGALARASMLGGDARYLVAAEAAAEALWRAHRRPGGGLYRASNGGHAEALAIVDDYAFFASGLIDLFEATGSRVHLEHAVTLAEEANARFAAKDGAWFLTEDDTQAPLGRRMALTDSVEPSGCAVMIDVLRRLAALTGRDDFDKAADHALGAYALATREAGLEMAAWLDASLFTRGPFYEVMVAGAPADSATRALNATWRGPLAPWVVGAALPAEGADEPTLALLAPALGKRAKAGSPMAYVCVKGACQEPTSSAAKLRSQIFAGWSH